MEEKNRNLANQLREIRDFDVNWPPFADFCQEMTKTWKKNLTRFDLMNHSVEDIAKDRIKWTSMIHGLEMVFLQMDSMIKELNDTEQKIKEEKKHGFSQLEQRRRDAAKRRGKKL